MHWLIVMVLELIAGVHRRDDNSIVGESRLDREAKRIETGCFVVLLIVAIAVVGYLERWW